MNLQTILLNSIQSSEYFKALYELKSFGQVLDEIYNDATHVEPFNLGQHASQAFCLMYKLFRMKLTENQMETMLTHTDSPYIRAIGFLYLRLSLPPKDLWSWLSPYFEDDEQFTVDKSKRRSMTMGQFIIQLLYDQKHFTLLLPRIPVPVFS